MFSTDLPSTSQPAVPGVANLRLVSVSLPTQLAYDSGILGREGFRSQGKFIWKKLHTLPARGTSYGLIIGRSRDFLFTITPMGIQGFLTQGQSGRSVKSTTQHLVPRLKIGKALLPVPHTSSYVTAEAQIRSDHCLRVSNRYDPSQNHTPPSCQLLLFVRIGNPLYLEAEVISAHAHSLCFHRL